MKKITILAAVVALLGSCAQNTEDTINPNTKAEGRTIYATFDNEEEATKTYVENYKYLRWHAGDEISFFDATTHNSQYAFAGNDGDAEGEFNAVATGEGTAIATTYGVYPYNANTTISTEGVLSVELPAIQAYGVNSFGRGANTMVAVGESATDDKLFFKNACGYLVVKLFNTSYARVKSLVLKGNNDEKIAGAATITATHAGVPSVTMADTATTSVTIDCGEGVRLEPSDDDATEFWFALPEITFEGGITITATDTEGKEYEKTTTKPVAITRNNVQPMKALSCEFAIPNTWKIYYTASSKVEPYNKTVFGANYVSNEWNSATGKGVITFDGEVTSIGERAFYNNDLKSITIPNSVTSIGQQAFYNCTSLTSATIPNSVSSLGSYAFYQCTSLTSVTIPDSVTNIGHSAFYGCSWLKKVYCKPTTPPSVVGAMFSVNASERKIYVPAVSVKAYRTAQYWSEYADAIVPYDFEKGEVVPEETPKPANNEIWYTSSDGAVATPYATDVFGANIVSNEWDGYSGVITFDGEVTSIGVRAFRSCSSLTSITIPDSVTSIGSSAFSGCSSLANINIPDSVTSIGDYAFYQCSELTSAIISEEVTIEGGAFEGCTKLSQIAIPDDSCIYSRAFYGCNGTESVIIGKNVDLRSSEKAFYGCTGELYVNSNIPSEGFDNSSFTTVSFGPDIKEWGSHAFSNCRSLKTIVLEDGTYGLGYTSFWNCDMLSRVEIKGKISYIEYNCFYEGSTPSFYLDDISDWFNITRGGVYNASSSYFPIYVNDEYIKDLVIPDSITEIPNNLFHCCTMSSITIHDKVEKIGASAFSYCKSLSKVYCNATTPPEATLSYDYWRAFDNCNSNFKIYVPSGSVSAYKTASGWSEYADYIVSMEMLKHTPVDLGLSVMWSSCNLYGHEYDEDNLYGWYDDFDRVGVEWSAEDPATKVLGDKWRVPTKSEWEELLDNCNVYISTKSYASHLVVESKVNGNKIYLPAGEPGDSDWYGQGYYWSSTSYNSSSAHALYFYKDAEYGDSSIYMTTSGKTAFQLIRPVYGDMAETNNGSYTLSLNNNWKKSSEISNPDSTLYDGVYESYSNYNVDSDTATMYIDINGYTDFKFYIRSNAESTYDYMMVSQLDETINGSTSYSNTSLVKAHTRGNQNSGTAISNYTLVEFSGLDGGAHRITIIYKKDGSVNSGTDRGYIVIPKNQ